MTIVVALTALFSVCTAALVCVVIVGRTKVFDGVFGIARAPNALTTGLTKFKSWKSGPKTGTGKRPGVSLVKMSPAAACNADDCFLTASLYARLTFAKVSPPICIAARYSPGVGILYSRAGCAQSLSTVDCAASTTGVAGVSLIGVMSFCSCCSDCIALVNSVSGIPSATSSGALAATSVMIAPLNAPSDTSDNSCQLAASTIITPSSS